MITPAQIKFDKSSTDGFSTQASTDRVINTVIQYLAAYKELYQKTSDTDVLAKVQSPEYFEGKFQEILSVKNRFKFIENMKKNNLYNDFHSQLADNYLLIYTATIRS